MNTSRIMIWYESGSVEEVHLQDPPYDAGACIQREYIDVSDPDEGIFIERVYIDSGEAQDGNAEYRELMPRTQVVSPDNLASAVYVEVNGVGALRRDLNASSKCGLVVTTPENFGFGEGEPGGPSGAQDAQLSDGAHVAGPFRPETGEDFGYGDGSII